ncbi:hypothetical protein LEMLEM_LOCUS12956, partial [Lemmus lemmus]
EEVKRPFIVSFLGTCCPGSETLPLSPTAAPGWSAGREGGSPSPSWDVPAGPAARDSPSLAALVNAGGSTSGIDPFLPGLRSPSVVLP